MDPTQKRKATKRIEIVRESGSKRRMRLSDIMSESFSKYLMELDGDFIAPTGARLSDLLEALKQGGGEYSPDVVARAQGLQKDPTEDPGKYLARAERELSATSPIAPGAAMLPDVSDEDDQVEPQPQPPAVTPPAVVAPPPATTPTEVKPAGAPPAEEERDVVVKPPIVPPGAPPTVPPPDDADDAAGIQPGGGDSNTVNVPERLEGGPGVVGTNDLPNPPVKPEDATGSVDVADTTDSPDDSSKELGGPDEFDEKNRPFTAAIDALISGGVSSPAPDVYEVSERVDRRPRSLMEAVYGSRLLVIDRG